MVALLVSTSIKSWSGLDGVAGLDEKVDDVGLGDGLAKLRHDDGNLRHKLEPLTFCARRRPRRARSGGAPSTSSDDTARACPWR